LPFLHMPLGAAAVVAGGVDGKDVVEDMMGVCRIFVFEK
jgi:hypothetical protein